MVGPEPFPKEAFHWNGTIEKRYLCSRLKPFSMTTAHFWKKLLKKKNEFSRYRFIFLQKFHMIQNDDSVHRWAVLRIVLYSFFFLVLLTIKNLIWIEWINNKDKIMTWNGITTNLRIRRNWCLDANITAKEHWAWNIGKNDIFHGNAVQST